MRSLAAIIEECKSGGVPSSDEMRYAICAMDALMVFDDMAMLKLVDQEMNGKPRRLVYAAEYQYSERLRRTRVAFSKSPKDYLGPNYDPDCEEVQQRRRASQALMKHLSRQ